MQKARRASRFSFVKILVLFGLLFYMLLFSRQVGDAVLQAFRLCIQVILPSLFPFMILSELLVTASEDFRPPSWLSGFTQRIFKLPAVSLLPFLLGALCGFPIGVKTAASLYKKGVISQKEYICTVCFVNNTGPAFTIAGIGGRLFGSYTLGGIVYAVQILSALLCGALLSHISTSASFDMEMPAASQVKTRYFTEVIAENARACLGIVGSVAVFSVILALLRVFVPNPRILLFLAAFLEVGNATSLAAEILSCAPYTALLFSCIAVSFGGLSVHLQAAMFMPQSQALFLRYVGTKLLQAAIASVLLLLFLLFI